MKTTLWISTALFSSVCSLAAATDPFAAFADGDLVTARAGAEAMLSHTPADPAANVLLGFIELFSAFGDPATQEVMAKLGYDLSVDLSALSSLETKYFKEYDPEAAWTYVSDVPALGGDAVRSGRSSENWGSLLAAEVTGPGLLSFRWLMEQGTPRATPVGLFDRYPEDNYVSGAVSLDGYTDYYEFEGLSGPLGEVHGDEIFIPPGQHTVYWIFWSESDSSQNGAVLYLSDLTFAPEGDGASSFGPLMTSGTLEDGLDAAISGLETGFTDRPLAEDPLTVEGFLEYLRTGLRPRLNAARSAFEAISANGGSVPLTFPALGGTGQTIRVDEADLLYLRGMMALIDGLAETFAQFEYGEQGIFEILVRLNIEIDTLAEWLANNPDALTRGGEGESSAALVYLNTARDLLYAAEAKSAERTEIADRDALFPRKRFPGEAWYPWGDDLLGDLIAMLPASGSLAEEPIHWNERSFDGGKDPFHLGPLFSSAWIPRAYLPELEGNRIALGSGVDGQTFPDGTFGGIFEDLDAEDLRYRAAVTEMGWWTFDRWRNLPGNASASLADYARLGELTVHHESSEWGNSGRIAFRTQDEWDWVARSDLLWRAEVSENLLTWEPVETWAEKYENIFGYYAWSVPSRVINFNYGDARNPLPSFFTRFSVDLLEHPTDWSGWEFEFLYQGSVRSSLVIESGERVVMRFPGRDGGAATERGPFDAEFTSEGPDVRIRWFDEVGYLHFLRVDLRGEYFGVEYKFMGPFLAGHPGKLAPVYEWYDFFLEMGIMPHLATIRSLDRTGKRIVIED
jgi:hypothetical protein